MSIPLMSYAMDPVYSKVAGQLRRKYGINVAEHVASMNVIYKNTLDGFWFTPKDHKRLINVLMATKAFSHDDRMDPFHAAAASQTQGEGYREVADISVHCQISESTVNMHIDNTGFMWRGPDGKSYIGPNAPAHILQELKWPEFVKWLSKKNSFAGKIAERTKPTIPSIANKFMPQLGAQFEIITGSNRDFSKQWSFTLDVRWGCTGYDCNRTETFTGLNFVYKHK